MNFGELRFWIIFFTGLGIILAGRVFVAVFGRTWLQTYDKTALLSLGLVMLGVVSWETLLIYITVALTTYSGLLIINRKGYGSIHWLWFLVPLQLTPLLYYKYSRFVAVEVFQRDWTFLNNIAIPVGISFYSFQMVAFAVDTLAARKPIPTLLDHLNFIGFFPQIVAGPIERRDNLLPQVEGFRFRWIPASVNEGVGWIVLGLYFKCCLADNFANFFDPSSTDSPLAVWRQNLLFGLRIYYDFAGYSLVAIGIAKSLGVDLTLNFRSPYCARTPVEFWRNWHITLSQWFRDYVYVPLGGGQVRWWTINILVVFVVSGIWHGAGWNFLIWGLLHAVFLISTRLLPSARLPSFVPWSINLFLVFFAWLAFYETRPARLYEKMSLIANPFNYSTAQFAAAIKSIGDPNVFVATCFLGLSAATLLLEWRSLRRNNSPYSSLRHPAVTVILVVLTVWLAPGKTNDFIYFAF